MECLLQRHHRRVTAVAGTAPADAGGVPPAELVPPGETGEPATQVAIPATSTADGAASSGSVTLETDAGRAPSPPSDAHSDTLAGQRTRKQLLHEQTRQLFQRGCTQSEIARRLYLNRRTVRRYLRLETMPEHQTRVPRGSLLAPFTAVLQQHWEQGCHNAAQLYRELRARGYSGGRTLVKQWVTQRRQQEGRSLPPPTTAGAKVSMRQVVWYFVRPPEELKEEERSCLERLCQGAEALRIAYDLAQRFGKMVRCREGEKLPGWLKEAKGSAVPELGRFAAGLERDGAAVKAGLELEWSNGPVEGQVQRLKTIKRQMYGRAKFDLLRRRVLHPT